MSRLTRLEVEGYMKIVGVDVPISGVTEISGKNGAGKTSFLSAIEVLIDGLKAAPEEPINNGAQRSRIRGRFGELNVIRYIERKKDGGYTTKLQFETPEGRPYPATQTQLRDLIGEHRLDPLDFLKLDSKERFKALQAFVPGIDFASSAREDAADYTRRTEVGRIARESRAAAGLIIVPPGTPQTPVDEALIVRDMKEASEQNTLTERRRHKRESYIADIAALRDNANAHLFMIHDDREKLTGLRDMAVEDLKQQIAAIQKKIDQVEATYLSDYATVETNRQSQAARLRADADAKQKELDAAEPLPPIIDLSVFGESMAKAKVTNAAVTRADERRRHIATAEKYEAEAESLTAAMDARRKARETAIAAAAIPVKGLEFGDGEIRLHGSPWEQASTAQKLKAAFEYCVGCNPKLRLAWIRDASLLDDDTFAEIGKLAAEMDLTVLLETVRPIGNNSVVLEAGRVKEIHQAQESAA